MMLDREDESEVNSGRSLAAHVPDFAFKTCLRNGSDDGDCIECAKPLRRRARGSVHLRDTAMAVPTMAEPSARPAT